MHQLTEDDQIVQAAVDYSHCRLSVVLPGVRAFETKYTIGRTRARGRAALRLCRHNYVGNSERRIWQTV